MPDVASLKSEVMQVPSDSASKNCRFWNLMALVLRDELLGFCWNDDMTRAFLGKFLRTSTCI